MRVPEGWAKMKIGDLCQPDSEQVSVAPDKTYKLMGVRWYGNGPHLHSEVLGEKLNTNTLNLIKEGRITYNKMWVSKSAFGVTSADHRGMYATAEYPTFVPSPRLYVDFMRHYMKLESFRVQALSRCRGTTSRARLNPRDFLDLEILLPPLSEQHRIAEALTDVDKAIEATQAVIEQIRVVKQNVLERLLSTGIGHTRFKQSEIGEVPEEWEVLRLESLLANVSTPMRSGPFGSALKKEELVDAGIPFLGIDNVHAERFVQEFKRFVTESKFEELRRFSVRSRDVMITIMGTVGRCCVVPKSVGLALSSKHVWTMTFDQSRCIPELICWQLNYAPWVLKEFERSAQGGVMGAINSSVLRELRLPVPPLEEQDRILSMWSSFQDALKAEHDKLGRLISLKFILFSDLMTGRKRLPVNILAAE
ncbi:restriction endonuclease subunit S [Azospirillum largimobile]